MRHVMRLKVLQGFTIDMLLGQHGRLGTPKSCLIQDLDCQPFRIVASIVCIENIVTKPDMVTAGRGGYIIGVYYHWEPDQTFHKR